MHTTPSPTTRRHPVLRALTWGATFVAFPLGGLLATSVVGAVDDVGAALMGGAIVGAVVGLSQALGSRALLPGSALPIGRWVAATTSRHGDRTRCRSSTCRLRDLGTGPGGHGDGDRGGPRRGPGSRPPSVAGDRTSRARDVGRGHVGGAGDRMDRHRTRGGQRGTAVRGLRSDRRTRGHRADRSVRVGSRQAGGICRCRRGGEPVSVHVIFGTGPVGRATARSLLRRGQEVRLVNRRGVAGILRERPEDAWGEMDVVTGDAADAAVRREGRAGRDRGVPDAQSELPPVGRGVPAAAACGACRGGRESGSLREHGQRLLLRTARGGGAARGLAERPSSRKGEIRLRMAEEVWAAHAAGRIEAVSGRASDYYGPGGGAASPLGDRVLKAAVTGTRAALFGDPDLPHSYTYIPDIGEGLAVLGTTAGISGRAWHLPNDPEPWTSRAMALELFRLAGTTPRIGRLPLEHAPRRRAVQSDGARAHRDGLRVRRAVRRGFDGHRRSRGGRHPHRDRIGGDDGGVSRSGCRAGVSRYPGRQIEGDGSSTSAVCASGRGRTVSTRWM